MVAEMVAAGATSLAVTEAGEWTRRVLHDRTRNAVVLPCQGQLRTA